MGGGISLAQTFLALLNNIPVNSFHTKHQTMNGYLPNSEYFCLIFLKTDNCCDRVHDGLYHRSGLGYLSLTVDLDDTEY